MRRAVFSICGLLLVALVVVAIHMQVPGSVAETKSGLSPFTAIALENGRNKGVLSPGEARWYEIRHSGYEGAFQQQMDLTLFFTPDDGHWGYRVNFQIFPTDQVPRWYEGDVSQMQNLGAGGIVSRDGNPVTGERLWSGWLAGSDTYYLHIFNDTNVVIDYWLFTDDVIGADLGPDPDDLPLAEATSTEIAPENPIPPASDVPVETAVTNLLPLASELENDLGVNADTSHASSGTPTRLVIPAIVLDSEVVPVSWGPIAVNGTTFGQWNTAGALVGWHDLSARLGHAGNTVLNGHSDTHARVFLNLDQVEVGDSIVVYSGEQVYHYVVVQKTLVQEGDVSVEERIRNTRWINPTEDERITLVTCANAGATHRLIVVASPAPPS